MNIFWMLLPDEAMILVIIGIGFALMLGLINRKVAMGFLGMVVLFLLLEPFLDSLFQVIPLWILLLILLAVGISIFRSFTSFFLGRRATSHMVGILAADVVRFLFGLIFFPFRILGWVFRRWVFR